MGVFDQNSLKFNDAIPNPSKDDNVDMVKCDNYLCEFYDHANKYCFYETCIVKLLKIKHHAIFNSKCEICDNYFAREVQKGTIPLLDLSYHLCPSCIDKLKKKIME